MRTILVALVVLISAGVAAAQYVPGGVPAGGGYGGGYGGYGYGHASTAEEGVQRGYADILRSQGMANLLNSQAAQGFEAARKDYMANRMLATQTYFEMRRYNTEARRAERPSPLSMEGYVRLAHQQAPAQLSTSQLDPLTGMINWPVPLQKNEYAELRKKVEGLYRDWAAGLTDYAAVDKVSQEFQERLKTDLPNFAANDYLAAKNFLTSLSYAARARS